MELVPTGSFVRNRELGTALAAGAVAIGLLLGASAAQAEVVIIDPGSVGNQAIRSPFAFEDDTNTLELRFKDNKTLEFGSTPPLIFSIQSNQVNTAYEGFLTDELGNQIAGTDFIGSTETGATQLLLDDFTVWSGLTVTGEWVNVSRTLYEIFWINSPKPIVGQVDAAGNQTPTADAGGSVTGVAGAAVGFDGSASSDPEPGTIEQYDWNFGDGNMSIDGGPTPSNTYADARIYN